MKTKFPLHIVTGLGLGTSYSSQTQVGELHTARSLGAAEINCYNNIATGNVVVFDKPLVVNESNFPIEFQYIYNSQAQDVQSGWRLGHRQFKTPFKPTSPPQTSMVLIDADGHETTYNLFSTTEQPTWCPPHCGIGRPFLQYDDTEKVWVLSNPQTQIKEYYDNSGRLISRCDALNRETKYTYLANEPYTLSTIQGPSGNQYSLVKKPIASGGFEHAVYLKTPEKADITLLQKWLFDKDNLLLNTTIPALGGTSEPYTINYTYTPHFNTQKILSSITQTDASVLRFKYQNNAKRFLEEAIVNDGVHSRREEYSYDVASASYMALGQGGAASYFKVDKENQLVRFERVAGIEGFDADSLITECSYTDNQIAKITHPNGGVEKFEYLQVQGKNVYGLLSKHYEPDNQLTQYFYDNTHHYEAMGQIQTLANNTLASQRQVYDFHASCKGQKSVKSTLLRFKISPEGQVTEIRYDEQGNPASSRIYINAKFMVETPPDAMIPIAALVRWVASQDASQVKLTTYKTNILGQIIQTKNYATVDAHGEGVEDAQTSLSQSEYNILVRKLNPLWYKI